MMSASPFKTVIVMPGASLDLTTLATVKLELGITDTEQDAWLQTKITQTSVAIASACGRVFQLETVADHFNLGWQSCDDALILSRYPISEVVSITESNQVLPADQYEFQSSNGLLYRVRGAYRSAWTGGRIIVTYSAGYELLQTLPHDLEQACLLLMKQSYFAKTRDPMIKGVAIPGVSTYDYWVGGVGQGGGMPPEVKTLLAPYKSHVVV
jgi:Phage gp6-like head-tail connector protein